MFSFSFAKIFCQYVRENIIKNFFKGRIFLKISQMM